MLTKNNESNWKQVNAPHVSVVLQQVVYESSPIWDKLFSPLIRPVLKIAELGTNVTKEAKELLRQ